MSQDKSLILNYHVGGFRQPRLSDPSIDNTCTSIKADGTVTTFKPRRRQVTAKPTVMTVKNDNAAQFARMLQLGSNNTTY